MSWGINIGGQLGIGTTSGPEQCFEHARGDEPCSRTPVAVPGLSEVTAIAAGFGACFALLRNGTVVAWGSNQEGALGLGQSGNGVYPTPTPVSGLTEVTAIAAGESSIGTALLKDGQVMDWGYGQFGELGNGANETSDVPVLVRGLSDVVALPHGGWGMALLGNGTVVDWGLDFNGQLGDGMMGAEASSDVPVVVSGLSGVKAIAGGFEHRLALLGNGTVVTWGNSPEGQISDVPVEVPHLTGIGAIAAGQYFDLAALG